MNSGTPKGVGGWLLFLCIILTIVTPLRLLRNMGAATQLSDQTKNLYPALSNAVLVSMVAGFVLAVMSVRAGVMLWRIRKGAVLTAQRFLLWLTVYAAACVGIAYIDRLPTEAQVEIRDAYGAAALQTLIFAAVWHQYLTRSKRVANTFSR